MFSRFVFGDKQIDFETIDGQEWHLLENIAKILLSLYFQF